MVPRIEYTSYSPYIPPHLTRSLMDRRTKTKFKLFCQKSFQTDHFRLKICEIHKPYCQIKTMLFNQSKQESNQG